VFPSIVVATHHCKGVRMSHSTDLLIVGGGLAGMSVALMVSRLTDWRVTLLEKRDSLAPGLAPSVDSRPISLAHASVCILKSVGVWPALASVASPIKEVLVTESGAFGGVHFSPQDWQLDALGYVVPIDFAVSGLWQALADSGVQVITGATVMDLKQDESSAKVSYRSGDKTNTLDAQCVIAADGSTSPVRSLLNIPTRANGPEVSIDVGEASCVDPHGGKAEQRFVPGLGVLATLPLLDPCRIRFVWTRASHDSHAIAESDEASYLAFWQKQCRGRLSIHRLTRQAHHCLQPKTAERVCDGRVVLLGDAARSIPPLAAQGFNLTLSDAAALVETMLQADKTGPGSWSHPSTLQRYASWRYRAKERLPRFLKTAQYAFSTVLPGLPVLRGAALTMIDCVPPLRRSIGQRLLGWGGRVPALARGVSVAELQESLLCHDQ